MTIAAQMHDHVMTLTGIPARRFFWDAPTTVDAFEEVAEYYQMDSFAAATDGYNREIEAMGGRMIYSDHAMPTIDFRDPLIKEPADLLRLKPPDFYGDGRLPYALDCIRLTAERVKGRTMGSSCGTFSMAVGMRSYPKLIRDMRQRPDFVRDLFTFIVDEVQVPYFKAQRDYAGITAAMCANAWAMVPNLSLAQLKEWIVPFGRRLTEKAGEFGVYATGGGGDYCEERLEKFDAEILHGCFDVQVALAGMPAIILGAGCWQDYPLEAVRDYTAPYRARGIKLSVRASINARLLRDGPQESIVEMVKRYIRTFGHDHELSMYMANIPADTPSDHVHAVVAAVHTYGRYPIAEDLDEVEFSLPRQKSFAEWRRMKSG